VDHAAIQRWVFKFTPLREKQFRKRKNKLFAIQPIFCRKKPSQFG